MQIVKPVHTKQIFLESIPVITVLTEIRVHDEIAIFRPPGQMNIVRIHALALTIQSQTRTRIPKLSQLLKKRPPKVELPPIIPRIPLVAMPTLPTINQLLAMRRKRTQSGLLAKTTLAWIQISLIAPGNPPLLSALRTMCWRRQRAFFLTKSRRNAIIKLQIVLRDIKPSRTFNTFFFHVPSLAHRLKSANK